MQKSLSLTMASKEQKFHVFFLPYMAPGHMIPTLDMARLFATRGLKPTIVTTPLNKSFFAETIKLDNQELDIEIELLVLNFPCKEAGLPEGCESADSVPSPELTQNFFNATALLQHPFEKLIEEFQPNCIVADSFFPWATSTALKFKIPRLSFHGCGYFSQCVFFNLIKYKPHKNVSSDFEHFVVPDLPHEIKLTRSELTPYEKDETSNWISELLEQIREAQKACFGVIMNSFYELEPGYADYYENSLGVRHWHIGPLSLYFRKRNHCVFQKGKSSSMDVSECMRWLDRKEANSVIYICFGSMSVTSDVQLHEIALALGSVNRNFILVVRKDSKDWMPDGFEARIEERGLVIRGWAPQGLILQHKSVGAFVTHCGWNSILEGVTMGLPMVTWPNHSEQFYNEKLVVQVLKIGVPVGVKKWVGRLDNDHENIVRKDQIVKAITAVMSGKEAEGIRNRARCVEERAKKAIEEEGSSYSSMESLIDGLISYKM